jgi:hypothetical protein
MGDQRFFSSGIFSKAWNWWFFDLNHFGKIRRGAINPLPSPQKQKPSGWCD